MSWSASCKRHLSLEECTNIDNYAIAPENISDESLLQFYNALDSVRTIIASNCIGDKNTKKFSIFISGHANKNHEPQEGWSNDCISINVTQG